MEQLKKDGKISYAKPGTGFGSPLAAGAVGLTSGAALGLIGSTLQNAVQKHSEGWKGVFTRTGGTIWTFGEYSYGLSKFNMLNDINS